MRSFPKMPVPKPIEERRRSSLNAPKRWKQRKQKRADEISAEFEAYLKGLICAALII